MEKPSKYDKDEKHDWEKPDEYWPRNYDQPDEISDLKKHIPDDVTYGTVVEITDKELIEAEVLFGRGDVLLQRKMIRLWWHRILREHGYYKCYAMLLALPSDTEVLHYATVFGKELDLISGKNCLIIVLANNEFKVSGFNHNVWKNALEDYANEGYSLLVARLFDISIEQFPCMILFRDIRTPDHLLFSLRGMSSSEISEMMRSLFATVQKAIATNHDVFELITKNQNAKNLNRVGNNLIGEFRSLAGKTFEAAMKAWIETIIKK